MDLYYFILKRYRQNYQQAKCILSFLAILLPFLAFSIFIRNTSVATFHTALFLNGWFTWTFTEYILHRFWMHHKNSNSPIAQRHHHHHAHPTEIVVTNLYRAAMTVILAGLV